MTSSDAICRLPWMQWNIVCDRVGAVPLLMFWMLITCPLLATTAMRVQGTAQNNLLRELSNQFDKIGNNIIAMAYWSRVFSSAECVLRFMHPVLWSFPGRSGLETLPRDASAPVASSAGVDLRFHL